MSRHHHSTDFTAQFLRQCFPEMWSIQTRGREFLHRVAMTRHVGGRVVGPTPGACSDGLKSTARQCTCPALCSADSPAIAQRPGPTCATFHIWKNYGIRTKRPYLWKKLWNFCFGVFFFLMGGNTPGLRNVVSMFVASVITSLGLAQRTSWVINIKKSLLCKSGRKFCAC